MHVYLTSPGRDGSWLSDVLWDEAAFAARVESLVAFAVPPALGVPPSNKGHLLHTLLASAHFRAFEAPCRGGGGPGSAESGGEPAMLGVTTC